MATNFEKYASSPEDVAYLIDQFRGWADTGKAWKSYHVWLDKKIRNDSLARLKSTTNLLTEWLKEEDDGLDGA